MYVSGSKPYLIQNLSLVKERMNMKKNNETVNEQSPKDVKKTRKRPPYHEVSSYKGDVKNDRKRISVFSS